MRPKDIVFLDKLREHSKKALEALRAQGEYQKAEKHWSVRTTTYRGKAAVMAWCEDVAVMEIFGDEMREQALKVELSVNGALYIQER